MIVTRRHLEAGSETSAQGRRLARIHGEVLA